MAVSGYWGSSFLKLRHVAAGSLFLASLFVAHRSVRFSGHADWSEATWVAAPVVQVDIASDPHVTSPAAEIGDCDAHERFLVQAVVRPHRTHVVAIDHIGGLYGP